MTHPSSGLIDQLVEVATTGAELAGQVLLDHRRRMREGKDLSVDTKTSATDPVSVADADSERALVDVITRLRPDDGLLGEEGSDKIGSTGLRWVLDPLDGTVNYLYDHSGWAVSIGVEQQQEDGAWEGVVGLVSDPAGAQTFIGATDRASTCNGDFIRVNDPVDLSLALVATGFSYDSSQRIVQARTVSRVLALARDIRRVGSAALDLCAVACGRVDAYYEDTTNRWDVAAGSVIVIGAGGVVSPLSTSEGRSGVVASGPTLHPRIVELVRRPE